MNLNIRWSENFTVTGFTRKCYRLNVNMRKCKCKKGQKKIKQGIKMRGKMSGSKKGTREEV